MSGLMMRRVWLVEVTRAVCRLSVLLAAFTSSVAHGQCTEEWLPGGAVPGVSGTVKAIVMWDSDGDGPLPPVLVAGGKFGVAGRTSASNIAVWDGTTWSALGSGLGTANVDTVNALAVTPSGQLIAGGTFTKSGAATINRVARWNGMAWTPLGSGVNNVVNALATTAEGDVIVGGKFATAGGMTVNRIARWRHATSNWAAFATSNGSGQIGVGSSDVNALLVLPNGDILVGGAFTNVGGESGVSYVARWSNVSTRWFSLGSGLSATVYALARLANGDIVAAGDGSGDGCVRVWNGEAWNVLGPLELYNGVVTGTVYSIVEMPGGRIVAAGRFINDLQGGIVSGYFGSSYAEWNGTDWEHKLPLPSQNSQQTRVLYALCPMPDGSLAVGSRFGEGGNYNDLFADDGPANGIARWNGESWQTFSEAPSTNDLVCALAALPDGGMLAAGEFVTIEGVASGRVARWSGSAWSAVGPGMDASLNTPAISAVAERAGGDIYAGGTFTSLNQGWTSARGFAYWDTNSWSAPWLEPSYARASALAVTPSNDLIVAGSFQSAGGVFGAENVARWNGSEWSALGDGLTGGVNAVAAAPNGHIFAAGYFAPSSGGSASYHVAEWDGTNWTTLGSGMDNTVNVLALLPNGDLVAGGQFTQAGGVAANRVAKWNAGAQMWQSLGSGVTLGATSNPGVKALVVLSSGDLVVGGGFASAGSVAGTTNLARWNGSTWSAVGGGVNGTVNALAVATNGTLWVGGEFVIAGGQVSAYLARWGCPASITVSCCRGTTCNAVAAGACTGQVAGSNSLVVGSCSAGNTTATCCFADFNHDGSPSIDDLFLYLNAYFTGSPWANVGGDGVAAPTIDDLFLFINAYFTGCV